jgi:hypothetical protein
MGFDALMSKTIITKNRMRHLRIVLINFIIIGNTKKKKTPDKLDFYHEVSSII